MATHSFPSANPLQPLDPLTNMLQFPSAPASKTAAFFPSPPASISSDPGLEFDIDSFTHSSTDADSALDDTFNWGEYGFNFSDNALAGTVPGAVDLSQSTSSTLNNFAAVSPSYTAPTPTSTTLISPKSSISSFADVGAPFNAAPIIASDADTAEALSNHHLQRYLHYKALAAQAEADARATAAALQNSATHNGTYEALLAGYPFANDVSFPMPMNQDKSTIDANQPSSAMLAFPQMPAPTFGVQSQPQYFAYNPQQQANLANAQAEAHLQAHDLAAARAQQSRMATNFWLDAAQPPFEAMPIQPQQSWSRHSLSTQSASPPFPSTPVYVAPAVAPMVAQTTAAPLPQPVVDAHPVAPSSAKPVVPIVPSIPASTAHSADGEDEIDEDDEVSGSSVSDIIPNLNGGGRGYIPGKTPDDPKKKHKCHFCGRGFARAFNLKSHIQTHSPARNKPHQCPHTNCRRGFSRLHDLERHRQGIHNDGPLVDAKVKGVAPSVARAQGRLQKRAADGSLI